MVFSSYEFLCFLPITLLGYFLFSKLKNGIYQRLFLLAASLFFYAYFNISYLKILLISIIVNYLLSKAMEYFKFRSASLIDSSTKQINYLKLIFIIGIIFNVGMLGYYKYYDFFIENINMVFGTNFVLQRILLPLGISFFTFQQISLLISIYKNEVKKVGKFIDFCIFTSFFPQLVAGPVVLHKEMMPQFTDESRRYINYHNLAKGIYIFSIGFVKKIVIADSVALFVNNGFGLNIISLPVAWVTALSYTLQIYFDFSGYSDMAVGLGKMLNIDIPINFLSPYKSESITEFWRRWHITLGRALSSYIYIPLGGNRKGNFRTYLNLFLTFLVSGLWHGADWTFVLWGVLHGICVILERMFKNILVYIPKAIKIAVTFFIVNLLWVLFRATSFQEAAKIYKAMFNINNISFSRIAVLTADGIVNFPTIIAVAYVLGCIVLLYFIIFYCKNTIEKSKNVIFNPKSLIFISTLFMISTVHLSRLSVFIYFNF